MTELEPSSPRSARRATHCGRSRDVHRVTLPPLPLDCGATLRQPVIAYHLEGSLDDRRDDVVLTLHALTGSSDVAGSWWRGLVGPGLALDTSRVAVLSPNLLGSCHGSSGPAADGDFPPITTRDQARALGVLLEVLRVPRVRLVTGGSLGGMVALEFVAAFPGRADAAVIFAAPAAASAAAIGWVHVQREIVRAAGDDGLALARQVAMLTYRTPTGLQRRFAREDGATGRAVQEWLRVHGERLAARFTPASYLALLDAMDSHDVGRGRGGIGERLRMSGTRLTGVGIPGDLVYPAEAVASWVTAAGGTYREIASDVGHDAFLVELDQVGAILAEALGASRADDANAAPSAPAEVA